MKQRRGAGSLNLKWGGKASLEKVVFEQRFEGREGEIWKLLDIWGERHSRRKSKVKILKCSWRRWTRTGGVRGVGLGALLYLEGLCKGFSFCSEIGSHLEGFQQRRGMFWQHFVQTRSACSAENWLNGAGGNQQRIQRLLHLGRKVMGQLVAVGPQEEVGFWMHGETHTTSAVYLECFKSAKLSEHLLCLLLPGKKFVNSIYELCNILKLRSFQMLWSHNSLS